MVDEAEIPDPGPIFVLKNEERRGPFSIEEVFDLLEAGELRYEDVCLREGATECERLRDVLDWEDTQKTEEPYPDAEDSTESKPEHEFATDPEPEPEQEPQMEQKPEPIPEPSVSPLPKGLPKPDGSKILYRGFPSVMTFPLPLLGLVGGIFAGAWFNALGVWMVFGGLFFALLCFVYLIFERSLRQYYITPRRVEMVTGFIAKSSKEALIEDIRAINVVRKGLPGMLGIGTVEFNTTGDEPEVTFDNVWSAKKVKALVRHIQDADE